MLQKQKDDMERLPEDQGFDKLKDVKVEGFGAALLAGYGWKEGMGIGKNAKEDVKIREIKQRTAKEGLGFVGDALAALVRSSNDKDKKKNEKGKKRCLRKLKESKIQREDRGRKRKRDRDEVENRVHVSRREERKGVGRRNVIEEKRVDGGRREERRVVDQRKVSWLTSHIRVRVISRDFKGGRLYLKKGEILDVVSPTTCDVSMDESREIVQRVSQDFLETAIPKLGGPVFVLAGKYKGVFGSLVMRDLDRKMAVVRDADTHDLLNVKFEQIAEYIGDPSLLGH